MADDENHVNLAVLSSEMHGLREDIGKLCTVFSKSFDDHEARIRILDKEQGEIKEAQAKFEERFKNVSGLQAAFTTIASIAAGIIGSRP